jgi:DNA topoisomerase VI subunit A
VLKEISQKVTLKITGEGVEHAVLQDAVHQAAKRIQSEHNLQFTVPSRMMNEGSWASTRTLTGDDTSGKVKEEKPVASKKSKKEMTQGELF